MTAVCGGRGTDALVASLIELKADVNAEAGNMKITALMYAALKGREAATAMLLRAGAACDAQDSRGGSAIFLATMLGHAHVVSQLIAASADASRAHPAIGMSAKDLAKEANHTAVVDLLAKTKEGGTGTTRQPPSADAAAVEESAAKSAWLARLDTPAWGSKAAALQEACDEGLDVACQMKAREEAAKAAWLAKLGAPTWGAAGEAAPSR